MTDTTQGAAATLRARSASRYSTSLMAPSASGTLMPPGSPESNKAPKR